MAGVAETLVPSAASVAMKALLSQMVVPLLHAWVRQRNIVKQ